MITNCFLLSVLLFVTPFCQGVKTCEDVAELKENLIKLSQLTRKPSFLSKHFLIDKHKIINTKLAFNFQPELVDAFNAFNLSTLNIHIRQYANQNWHHSFDSELFMQTNKSCHTTGYIEKCFDTNSTALESINFNLADFGDYIICWQFSDPPNNQNTLLNDQICQDWSIKSGHHVLGHHDPMYKPLFIVVMYVLCFFFLCPTAIAFYYKRNKVRKASLNGEQIEMDEDESEKTPYVSSPLLDQHIIKSPNMRYVKPRSKSIYHSSDDDHEHHDIHREAIKKRLLLLNQSL